MTAEQALYAYLSNEAGITNIVGDRIYPGVRPQDSELPAISYLRISGPEHHNIDVAFPRFQISAWAATYNEAKTLGNEIKAAFQRFKGTMGGAQGVDVIQGVLLNDNDIYESDTRVYHNPVDIKLIHWK